MTLKIEQDEVLRMAREAGLVEPYHPYNPWSASQEGLERFAALVAAYEREACAKVCEELEQFYEHTVAPQQCAYNIRARSEK